jgi:plasmid stabilization system protein ParE
MKIIWLDTAREQLDEIYDFIAKQSVKAAAGIYNDIIDEADRLSDFPEMAAFEPLLNGEVFSYRSLIVRRTFKVIYRINSNAKEVIIVSVWDCRQNPEMLKGKITG